MSDSFDKADIVQPPTTKDSNIQQLEKKVVELEERLYEERFYWVLGLVILVDMFVFSHMLSWAGPVTITLLEFIGLIALANKCGVDIVVRTSERLLDGWVSISNK